MSIEPNKTLKQIISELLEASKESQDMLYLEDVADDLTVIADNHVRMFKNALKIRVACNELNDPECQSTGAIAFELTKVETEIELEIQNSTVDANILAMLPPHLSGSNEEKDAINQVNQS